CFSSGRIIKEEQVRFWKAAMQLSYIGLSMEFRLLEKILLFSPRPLIKGFGKAFRRVGVHIAVERRFNECQLHERKAVLRGAHKVNASVQRKRVKQCEYLFGSGLKLWFGLNRL